GASGVAGVAALSGAPPTAVRSGRSSATWFGWCPVGRVRTIVPARAAATGTRTSSDRLRRKRRRGTGSAAAAAIARTRSRTSAGAATRAVRSSATRSRCDIECLLELLERPAQARGAVRLGDAEHAGRRSGVEVEQDPERDDLALARAERRECGLEVGREPLGETLLDALLARRELLASCAPAFGAEVVERHRPRDLAEPGAGGAAGGVEPMPEPQRALERLGGQLLRDEAVGGEPGEVAVHVVEVRLGGLREGHLHTFTPPRRPSSHFRAKVGVRPGPDPEAPRPAWLSANRRELRAGPDGSATRSRDEFGARPGPDPGRAPRATRRGPGRRGARGRRRGPRRSRPRGCSRGGRGSTRAASRCR